MTTVVSSGGIVIEVTGARGPRGLASGPLGAGSVDAPTITNDPAAQEAIRDKLDVPSNAEFDDQVARIDGAIANLPAVVFRSFDNASASDGAQVRRAISAASVEALKACALNFNGNCRISQERGANEVAGIGDSTTNGAQVHAIDGHKVWVKGTARTKAARVAVTDLPGFTHALRIDVTTAEATMAAGDFVRHVTIGTSDRFSPLAWGTAKARGVVRYAWVKTSMAGTYLLAVLNDARTFAAPAAYFTVDAPNVWQLVRTIIPPQLAASTWDANGIGYRCEISLASSTGPNLAAEAGHYFMTTGELFLPLDYDPGLSDTALLMPSLADNLRACQRYYRTSYNLDVVPGAVTSVGAPSFITEATANYHTVGQVAFGEHMGSTPSVTVYSPNSGAAGKAYDANGPSDVDLSVQNAGQSGFTAFINNVSVAAARSLSFHYVADARIG